MSQDGICQDGICQDGMSHDAISHHDEQPAWSADAAASTASKPTSEWVTGDEPPTGPQLSYLETLAHEVGEQVPDGLTKARASELIDEYRNRSPRVDT
jgi:hypothetical protein